MMAVGHTAIGVAIGLAVPNPYLAFGIGVISHHVADAVPHFDPGSFLLDQPWHMRTAREFSRRDWLMVAIDAVLSLILLLGTFIYLPSERWMAVSAGVFGALLPDLVHNVPFWSGKLRKISWIAWWQDHIHRRFQWTVPARSWPLGLGTQFVTISLAIWYLISLRGS